MPEKKKFYFYCVKYPFMRMVVEDEQYVAIGAKNKVIPQKWAQFQNGKLTVEDENHAKVLRLHPDFGNFFWEKTEAELKRLPLIGLKKRAAVQGLVGSADIMERMPQ